VNGARAQPPSMKQCLSTSCLGPFIVVTGKCGFQSTRTLNLSLQPLIRVPSFSSFPLTALTSLRIFLVFYICI
jgi:hypothetical protein